MTIPIPSGARVWLATGRTDMRKGFDGLALLVQDILKRDPHGGHLFVFRGRRGNLIKVLWHDGQGLCLFSKLIRDFRGSRILKTRSTWQKGFGKPPGGFGRTVILASIAGISPRPQAPSMPTSSGVALILNFSATLPTRRNMAASCTVGALSWSGLN
jgi:hypothetical protein